MPTEREIREVVRRVVEGLRAEERSNAVELPRVARGGDDRTVAIGADHGGWALKRTLATHLAEKGYEVSDCGTDGPDSVDYPVFAHEVARRVAAGECRWGIVVDGAGLGSCMVANKVPGVRAAVAWDLSSARNGREHNHANVLTLGAGLLGESLARQIVDEWLVTPWGEGRHARRVAMIDDLEGRTLRSGRA